MGRRREGAVDHALPGLSSQSELARGLTSEPNPSGPRLETLSNELRRFRYDDAAEVRVGLSSPSGLKWQSFPGSQPSNRGPLPAVRTLGCTEVTPKDVDVNWAQKHRCDVLYIGCCEKDGRFLLWEQRSLARRTLARHGHYLQWDVTSPGRAGRESPG